MTVPGIDQNVTHAAYTQPATGSQNVSSSTAQSYTKAEDMVTALLTGTDTIDNVLGALWTKPELTQDFLDNKDQVTALCNDYFGKESTRSFTVTREYMTDFRKLQDISMILDTAYGDMSIADTYHEVAIDKIQVTKGVGIATVIFSDKKGNGHERIDLVTVDETVNRYASQESACDHQRPAVNQLNPEEIARIIHEKNPNQTSIDSSKDTPKEQGESPDLSAAKPSLMAGLHEMMKNNGLLEKMEKRYTKAVEDPSVLSRMPVYGSDPSDSYPAEASGEDYGAKVDLQDWTEEHGDNL